MTSNFGGRHHSTMPVGDRDAVDVDAVMRERDRLREALKRLRNGYADAVGGLRYIEERHGRLAGVGWDRVFDHYFDWVEMPEREGLLAGSHNLPLTPENPS